MASSSLTAIWQGKCPRCRKGQIFQAPLSQVSSFSKMNRACTVCEASFEPEPGFYFGAMFISYAFNVVIFVACWLVLYMFADVADWVYILVVALAAVAFTPFNFRASRVLWLYWFGGHSYDRNATSPQ